MIAELIADHVWSHSASLRASADVTDMRETPAQYRAVICRMAGMSRVATDDEWGEACDIIERRTHAA